MEKLLKMILLIIENGLTLRVQSQHSALCQNETRKCLINITYLKKNASFSVVYMFTKKLLT